jgi:hypothetical protein
MLRVHEKGLRRRAQSVGVGVLLLFDPVVGEALLLGFFELRGDAFDAKVVGVAMCLIWQGGEVNSVRSTLPTAPAVMPSRRGYSLFMRRRHAW